MSKPPTPTSRPLKKMASHVAFEFKRLSFTASPENFLAPAELGGVVRESFLIHFRNVLDFLSNYEKFPTDVVAAHYIPGWEPTRRDWEADDRARCNKLLAHLTYERVDYEDRRDLVWKDLQSKALQLLQDWEIFKQALSDEERAWFK